MGRDLFSFFSRSVFFLALFVGSSIAFCFWFRLGNLFFVVCCFSALCFVYLSVFLLLCFVFFVFLLSVFFLLFCFASLLCCFFVFLFLYFSALVLYHHVWCKSNFSPMQRSYSRWLFLPHFFAGQYLPCFLEFHQILVRQSQSYPHFPIISHYMPLY